MTGAESRLLKVGDRVRWGNTVTDCGTVIKTTWSDATIDWDDGQTTSIQHNDMAHVERLPTKIV
jgi:small-conductance mechanosensitive channel